MDRFNIFRVVAVGISAILLFSIAGCASLTETSPLREYISGWKQHDGEAVAAVFADAGAYFDADKQSGIGRSDIAARVEAFSGAEFAVAEIKEKDNGRIALLWNVTWPDSRGTLQSEDTILIADGKIRMVENVGSPASPEIQDILSEYLAHRLNHQTEAAAAFYGEDGLLFGRTLPAAGLSGQEIVSFFDSLAGMSFRKREDSIPRYTKDGRVYFDWDLFQSNGTRLAGGRDFITFEGTRFKKLVGVY